jgi:hypothetical protein
MQNLFLLSVLIYLALKLLYILIGLFKKSKTKDKAAIVALRDVNLSLIEAVFYFIALIIFFRIFAKWYYQVYSILIPVFVVR